MFQSGGETAVPKALPIPPSLRDLYSEDLEKILENIIVSNSQTNLVDDKSRTFDTIYMEDRDTPTEPYIKQQKQSPKPGSPKPGSPKPGSPTKQLDRETIINKHIINNTVNQYYGPNNYYNAQQYGNLTSDISQLTREISSLIQKMLKNSKKP